MPTKTVQKFLHRNLKYLHACQNGLLTKTDIDKQLQIAKKDEKRSFYNFLDKRFYSDGASFFINITSLTKRGHQVTIFGENNKKA